ncbi:hypothetical protein GUB10_13740 [Salegentibacter sp. BLCTC]|uniref:hypothetical protein n=1 Tax=Salegentibacter sp. BLCTC TaxID=2697368 RepID=UPI00187BAD34|nr:hypothetical protein [Salegentibacter sp. BLCTC]MBE7641397.1 hypothetical protein [Salegentibacter sp. BLCTC]
MKSIEKLEKIKSILEESFFQEHLDSFWGDYQLMYRCPNRNWDGRDSFTYPIQYHSKIEIESRKLSEGIIYDIKYQFKSLEKEFLSDSVSLDESSKSRLIQLLKNISKEIELESISSKIPNHYRDLIIKEFTNSKDNFIDRLNRYDYPSLSENGIYYRKLGTKKGKKAFGKFYQELLNNNFIPNNITEKELADLFSNKKLTKRIVWGGSPEEANHFFKILDSKDFIEITSLWLTVGEHFDIKKKRGGYYHPTKMRGLPYFQKVEDRVRIREINTVIETLNV